MKQSVLDRNAWLAGSLLRQKQKGTRQEQPGNEKAETWLCMKKQIFLNNLKKKKKKENTERKERENLLCKHLLLYISKQTAAPSQVYSACTLIFSTKLTLIRSVPSASLNTFDCLHQFTGFYFGKLFHHLAQNITNTVL